MTKVEIKSKIEKLQKGIDSKATPKQFIAKLKAEKEKLEKELAELSEKKPASGSISKAKQIANKYKSKSADTRKSSEKNTSKKEGNISSIATYVPNRDIKELHLVLRGELKNIKGSDILDGVYVKNGSKQSETKLSAKSILDKIKSELDEDYINDLQITESDIQSLLDVGMNEEDILICAFGYGFVKEKSIVCDNEFAGYRSGFAVFTKDYQKKSLDRIKDNVEKGYYEIGLKYPSFNWVKIIEKFDINKTPKIIKTEDNRPSEHEVFIGKGVAIGHTIAYTDFNGNLSRDNDAVIGVLDLKKPNEYQSDRNYKAGFNGGYWGIVTKSKKAMYEIIDMLVSQKGGYLKDLDVFSNGLGGIQVDDVEGKFNHGGKLTYDREKYTQLLSEYDKIGAYLEDAETKEEREKYRNQLAEIESKLHKYERNYADGGQVDAKIKDWYTKKYPTDDLGERLNDVTFKDLWDALNKSKDVYEVIGVGDSIIRERLFEHLSEIKGVDCNVVYKKWLNTKYADGGGVDEEPNRFKYMMLGRLQTDNDYYLGYGNRNPKHLWAGNVKDQIAEMKKLWNELPKDKKPEWLSMEDILDYENKMSDDNKMADGGGLGINLDEYLNQSDPIFNPMVNLKPKDYTIGHSMNMPNKEKLTEIYINTDDEEWSEYFKGRPYILKNNSGFLYVMDADGNPTKKSVFYIEDLSKYADGGALDGIMGDLDAPVQNVGGTLFSTADLTSHLDMNANPMFKDGGHVPAHHGKGKNIDVFGYQTKYFTNCPKAVEDFENSIEHAKTEEEKEGLIKIAEHIDKIFEIEHEAVQNNKSTSTDLNEAIKETITASYWNYRSGMAIDLFSFLPQHIEEIATKLHKSTYADGGEIKKIKIPETEKEKREVYKLAFGKEYDSEDRKQAPLPIDIATIVAMRKLETDEGYKFYADGGALDSLMVDANAPVQNVGGTLFSTADLTSHLDFNANPMFAKGGEVDSLKGKLVRYDLLGGGSGMFVIDDVMVSPSYYSKREVSLYTKEGGVDKFPYEKLSDFMNGKSVEVRDSKGEPYTLTLRNVMAEGGSIHDRFQIKSDKGYYSRSMSTGKAVFLDSSEMGYTFTKEDAEKMLQRLEKETGKDLEIVEYKPYKMAEGGGIGKNVFNGTKFKTEEEAKTFIKLGKASLRKNLREGNYVLAYNGKEYFIAEKNKMAEGGEINDRIEEVKKDAKHYSKVNKIKTYVFDYEFDTNKRPITRLSERFTFGTQEDLDYMKEKGFDKEYKVIATYENGEEKMSKGGKTTFNDKVKSIAEKLLKNKKVSPKVQKDYGKTFDKKEALDSAKRIAGAMRKKEMAKKKR